MREIVKRTFIVLWIVWVGGTAFLAKELGPGLLLTWQVSGWAAVGIWGLQFIATGIPNPITLIETTEFRRK